MAVLCSFGAAPRMTGIEKKVGAARRADPSLRRERAVPPTQILPQRRRDAEEGILETPGILPCCAADPYEAHPQIYESVRLTPFLEFTFEIVIPSAKTAEDCRCYNAPPSVSPRLCEKSLFFLHDCGLFLFVASCLRVSPCRDRKRRKDVSRHSHIKYDVGVVRTLRPSGVGRLQFFVSISAPWLLCGSSS